MVSESEVRARFQAYQQELHQLETEIQHLQWRVKMGTENWRVELEQLAERAERRRALSAQQQALQWVLNAESAEHEPRQIYR